MQGFAKSILDNCVDGGRVSSADLNRLFQLIVDEEGSTLNASHFTFSIPPGQVTLQMIQNVSVKYSGLSDTSHLDLEAYYTSFKTTFKIVMTRCLISRHFKSGHGQWSVELFKLGSMLGQLETEVGKQVLEFIDVGKAMMLSVEQLRVVDDVWKAVHVQ